MMYLIPVSHVVLEVLWFQYYLESELESPIPQWEYIGIGIIKVRIISLTGIGSTTGMVPFAESDQHMESVPPINLNNLAYNNIT